MDIINIRYSIYLHGHSEVWQSDCIWVTIRLLRTLKTNKINPNYYKNNSYSVLLEYNNNEHKKVYHEFINFGIQVKLRKYSFLQFNRGINTYHSTKNQQILAKIDIRKLG